DAKTFAAPDAFRERVGEVVTLYAEVAERLAADDASGARLSLRALEAAVDALDAGALDAEALLAWERDADTLRAAVGEAGRGGAGDLERQRRGFLALSEALPGILRRWRPILEE